MAQVRYAEAVTFVRRNDAGNPRLSDFLLASGQIALAAGDRTRARRDLTEGVPLPAAEGDRRLTERTAKRNWRQARTFLLAELSGSFQHQEFDIPIGRRSGEKPLRVRLKPQRSG